MIAYAGIGSRQTPLDVLNLMHRIAVWLAGRDFTLRSGAAGGADSAFENGCDSVQGKKEIFLPWKRFNNHPSQLFPPSEKAFNLAAEIHPNWGACSNGAMALHARNCHQVLGWNLDSPVEMVCCWTHNGSGHGGTGQAIRLARQHGIAIYDLGHDSVRQSIELKIQEYDPS